MMSDNKSDDWLIRNAIGCWLHYFPEHPWRERYEELVKRKVYLTPPKPRPARKRSQSRSKDTDATTGKEQV